MRSRSKKKQKQVPFDESSIFTPNANPRTPREVHEDEHNRQCALHTARGQLSLHVDDLIFRRENKHLLLPKSNLTAANNRIHRGNVSHPTHIGKPACVEGVKFGSTDKIEEPLTFWGVWFICYAATLFKRPLRRRSNLLREVSEAKQRQSVNLREEQLQLGPQRLGEGARAKARSRAFLYSRLRESTNMLLQERTRLLRKQQASQPQSVVPPAVEPINPIRLLVAPSTARPKPPTAPTILSRPATQESSIFGSLAKATLRQHRMKANLGQYLQGQISSSQSATAEPEKNSPAPQPESSETASPGSTTDEEPKSPSSDGFDAAFVNFESLPTHWLEAGASHLPDADDGEAKARESISDDELPATSQQRFTRRRAACRPAAELALFTETDFRNASELPVIVGHPYASYPPSFRPAPPVERKWKAKIDALAKERQQQVSELSVSSDHGGGGAVEQGGIDAETLAARWKAQRLRTQCLAIATGSNPTQSLESLPILHGQRRVVHDEFRHALRASSETFHADERARLKVADDRRQRTLDIKRRWLSHQLSSTEITSSTSLSLELRKFIREVRLDEACEKQRHAREEWFFAFYQNVTDVCASERVANLLEELKPNFLTMEEDRLTPQRFKELLDSKDDEELMTQEVQFVLRHVAKAFKVPYVRFREALEQRHIHYALWGNFGS